MTNSKPVKKEKTRYSICCNAVAYTAHGCDSDLGHGGRPCNCAETNSVVTMWYECSHCKKPCDTQSDNTVDCLQKYKLSPKNLLKSILNC